MRSYDPLADVIYQSAIFDIADWLSTGRWSYNETACFL